MSCVPLSDDVPSEVFSYSSVGMPQPPRQSVMFRVGAVVLRKSLHLYGDRVFTLSLTLLGHIL
jgi:hypothetical protein